MTAPRSADDEPGERSRGPRAGRRRAPKASAGKGRSRAKRPRPVGKRRGRPAGATAGAPAASTEGTAARSHPSAYKLIAAVALIVALDILLFFAIGYFVGTQIL